MEKVLETSNNSAESPGRANNAKRDFALLALFALAAIVLAWPTLHQGIWLDEFLSINSSTAPDMVTMLKNSFGRQDDYHPPLAYILLHEFMNVFGRDDVVVKVPFLLCGIATIPAVYWLGRTAHSARVGLLAAWFFVIAPLANFLSCQCRGYALATLLSTLCLAFFIQLQSNLSSSQRMSRRAAFIGVTLTAAGLCYTEYIGCVMLPALGLATVIICARRLKDAKNPTNNSANSNSIDEAKKDVISTFIRCATSLFLALVLFIPWIPSVLNQTHGALYVDRMPLSRGPEMFYWNVMNVLPIHIGLGAVLLLVILILLTAKHLRGKKNAKNNSANLLETEIDESKTAEERRSHEGNTDAYIVLWCSTLFPCLIMGFITNWFAGYFRYIYPYAPGAWVLFSIAVFMIFWNQNKIMGASRIGLAAFIVILSAVDISWNLFHARSPNSGFSTVAKDAKIGRYDRTAFLVAPEAIAPTLGYYLPKAEREAHKIGIFGFAKWENPTVPIYIPEIATAWAPDTLVNDTMSKIAALPAKGYKFLAFTKDSDKQLQFLSTERMPRKKRVDELIAALDAKYKKLSEKHHDAVTEDVTVSVYDLQPSSN